MSKLLNGYLKPKFIFDKYLRFYYLSMAIIFLAIALFPSEFHLFSNQPDSLYYNNPIIDISIINIQSKIDFWTNNNFINAMVWHIINIIFYFAIVIISTICFVKKSDNLFIKLLLPLIFIVVISVSAVDIAYMVSLDFIFCLIYLLLQAYYLSLPLAERLRDKLSARPPREPKPKKPTKEERIAQLEREIQELKKNKQGE